MNKQELQKIYQKIVLKTNGGVDDYVVALCQIGNAISELDDQQQQIADLQHRLDVAEKELSKYRSYKTTDERIRDLENLYSDYKKENQQLKERISNQFDRIQILTTTCDVEKEFGDKMFKENQQLKIKVADFEKLLNLQKESK